MPTSVGQWFDG